MLDRRNFLILGAGSSLFWPGLAHAQPRQPRFGLVIGNNSYPAQVGPLKNAVNDARLIADVLKQCGFQIPDDAVLIDADKATMERRIRAHAARLTSAGKGALGFIYYAGHGAARPGGDNYLIPILSRDTDVNTASVWDESVGVEWLLSDALANQSAAHIVALDACRNQLKTSERSVGGSGSFSVRGLSVVQRGENANMFLSFSTWQGQTASDGGTSDKHGPYALALANSLTQPGPILIKFDQVRRQVMRLTVQSQEVMNVSRLGDAASDFEIGGGVKAGTVPALPLVVAEAPQRRIGEPVNIALCISCTYDGPGRLAQSKANSRKVAAALKASSFATTTLHDPDRAALEQAILDFRAKLDQREGDAVGVIFFSGHSGGIQGIGNLIVPQGPVPRSKTELQSLGYPLSAVFAKLTGSKSKAIVIFLDACRPLNPAEILGKGFGSSDIKQAVEEPGQGPVLVGYSVTPGQFADPYRPSVFADALAEEIVRPERRDVSVLLARVSEKVQMQTRGRMRPSFVQSAPIYFRDGRGLDAGA